MKVKKLISGAAGIAGCIAGGMAAAAAVNKALARQEERHLTPPGKIVEVNGHKMHVYGEGARTKVTCVFLSGGGTIAPVYDFRPLYRRFRLITDVLWWKRQGMDIRKSRQKAEGWMSCWRKRAGR